MKPRLEWLIGAQQRLARLLLRQTSAVRLFLVSGHLSIEQGAE
jgi:hypothetical protein